MKEKGKHNPFAAFLRPTEELLWQSPERATVLDSILPKFNVHTALVIILFIIVIVAVVTVIQDSLIQSTLDFPASPVGLAIVIFGLVSYFLRFVMRGAARGETLGITLDDHAFYAVTSERLFYERGQDIQAVELEQISLVNSLSPNDTRGTLSFGAVFPMWTGLENAEHVKTIIEQAQKERLKENGA